MKLLSFYTLSLVILVSSYSYSFKLTTYRVNSPESWLTLTASAESSIEGPISVKEYSIGRSSRVAKVMGMMGALIITSTPGKSNAFLYLNPKRSKAWMLWLATRKAYMSWLIC